MRGSGFYNYGTKKGSTFFKKQGAGTSISVYNQQTAPRQASRPGKQYIDRSKYVYTEADKEEIKRYQIEIFNDSMRLAVLPGDIPMCYAVGYGLVTDKWAWAKYWTRDCYYDARKMFWFKRNPKITVEGMQGLPGAGAGEGLEEEDIDGDDGLDLDESGKGKQSKDPSFTWGFRPISATKITPIDSVAAESWVWNFIRSNILKYPAARAHFKKAIRQLQVGPEFNWSQEASDILMQCCTKNTAHFMEIPPHEVLSMFMGQIDITHVKLCPTQLSVAYRKGQKGLTNLMLLQNLENMQQASTRLNEQIRRISRQQSDADDTTAAAVAAVVASQNAAGASTVQVQLPVQVQGTVQGTNGSTVNFLTEASDES